MHIRVDAISAPEMQFRHFARYDVHVEIARPLLFPF